MNTKAFILEFVVIFMITFVVAAIVSFGWNYFSAGNAECSWGTAALFALIFGSICPVIDMIKSER